MCEQNASYLAMHTELGSKSLNKICVKIIQNALKWPLQQVNFQNFPGGVCPWTPVKPFLLLNQLQFFSAKIKITRKNVEIMSPFLNFSLRHCSECPYSDLIAVSNWPPMPYCNSTAQSLSLGRRSHAFSGSTKHALTSFAYLLDF